MNVVLDSGGEFHMLNVEKDRWHSLECLESGSVLYESKDGPYHPLEEDEVWKLQNSKVYNNGDIESG